MRRSDAGLVTVDSAPADSDMKKQAAINKMTQPDIY